jgi:hypothetical protein
MLTKQTKNPRPSFTVSMTQSTSDSTVGSAELVRRISRDPAWVINEMRRSRHKTSLGIWEALSSDDIIPFSRSLVNDGILEVLKSIITDPGIPMNSVNELVCDLSGATF